LPDAVIQSRRYGEPALVLLDLDGTLTDPYDGIARSVAYAITHMGMSPLPEQQLRSFIGPPLQDQFATLGLDAREVERAVSLYRERFTERGPYENRVYVGVEDTLAALTAASLRLAVATSKPTTFAERIVRHFGLDKHLDLGRRDSRRPTPGSTSGIITLPTLHPLSPGIPGAAMTRPPTCFAGRGLCRAVEVAGIEPASSGT